MYSNITLDELNKQKILGEGTYGKCYLVQNKRNNQKCVLKQIQIFGMSQQQQQQVIKQAKILSVLDHTNIVKFYTFFKTQSYINIVMEYADGGDLNKIIRDTRANHFSQHQILHWFTQICLAIQHIHDRKVIHRDLKCQNIFMTKDGNIKLGDFGIAKHLSKTLQKIKTVVGTPYYMSPQICENKDYSFKTDIWSLGVILYQMCQLKLPFDGGSLPVLALKISRGQYPAITANYSKQLKILVKNLLQNNPNKRPSITKILQNSLLSKRIPQNTFDPPLIKQYSSYPQIPLSKNNLQQKQNQQQLLQQSTKDNSINTQNIIDNDKKNQFNSVKSNHPNPNLKQNKTPKNSDICLTKLKDFSTNNCNINRTQKDKKKKQQIFKQRQISQPNLAIKKPILKNDYIQLVKQQQQQQKQQYNQNIIITIRNIIRQKFQQKTQFKIRQTSSNLGLIGSSFNGNGIVSLMYGLQKF